MDELRERKVIARLKAGSISALTPLVRAYQHRALRAAYLVTQDQALAEDITQSAFLRAFECIAQFDVSRRFLPWFLRIVVNLAIQAAQKQARVVPLETAFDMDVELSLTNLLPDVVANPEAQVEMQELEDQVKALLERLSPEQRAVIVLRYYVDLSEDQMAEILEVPPGTIKSRLFGARQQLRRLLSSGSL